MTEGLRRLDWREGEGGGGLVGGGLLVVVLLLIVNTQAAPWLLVELAAPSLPTPVSVLQAQHGGESGVLSGEAGHKVGVVGVVVELFCCTSVVVETIAISLVEIIELLSLKTVLT